MGTAVHCALDMETGGEYSGILHLSVNRANPAKLESSDYTTLLLTNRWYLRIIFWVADRVIYALYKEGSLQQLSDGMWFLWWTYLWRVLGGPRILASSDLGPHLMVLVYYVFAPDVVHIS